MTVTELQAPGTGATPIIEPAPDYSELRQLIRERLELSDNPDPVRAVNGLLADLPDELFRLAAVKGLWAITTEVARASRVSATRTPSESGKWNDAAATVDARPDLFAERVYVGDDGWKFLGDCTKADLQAAAEHKRVHAQGVLAVADQYDRLARLVRRGQVVRDLAVERVEKIFNA